MARFNATEIDRVIHDIEFENQQYVKQIEKERQEIDKNEKERQTLKIEINLEEEKTPLLDDAIKNYHKQFTHNRNNTEHLRKTLEVLSKHEDALGKRLETVKAKAEEECEERKKQLDHYQNIWKSHKVCYDETFPVAEDVEKQKQEIYTAKELLSEACRSQQKAKQQLEEFNLSADFEPFTDVNSFILAMSKLYIEHRDVKASLKQLVCTYSATCEEVEKVEAEIVHRREKEEEFRRNKEELAQQEKLRLEQEKMRVEQERLARERAQQNTAAQGVSSSPSRGQVQQQYNNQTAAAARQNIQPAGTAAQFAPRMPAKLSMNRPLSNTTYCQPQQQTLLRHVHERQMQRKVVPELTTSRGFNAGNYQTPVQTQNHADMLQMPTMPQSVHGKMAAGATAVNPAKAERALNTTSSQVQFPHQKMMNVNAQNFAMPANAQNFAMPANAQSLAMQQQVGAQGRPRTQMPSDRVYDRRATIMPIQVPQIRPLKNPSVTAQQAPIQIQQHNQVKHNQHTNQQMPQKQPADTYKAGFSEQEKLLYNSAGKAVHLASNAQNLQFTASDGTAGPSQEKQANQAADNCLPHDSEEEMCTDASHPSKTPENTPGRVATSTTPLLSISPNTRSDSPFDLDKYMQRAKVFSAKSPGGYDLYQRRPMINEGGDRIEPGVSTAMDTTSMADAQIPIQGLSMVTSANSFLTGGGDGVALPNSTANTDQGFNLSSGVGPAKQQQPHTGFMMGAPLTSEATSPEFSFAGFGAVSSAGGTGVNPPMHDFTYGGGDAGTGGGMFTMSVFGDGNDDSNPKESNNVSSPTGGAFDFNFGRQVASPDAGTSGVFSGMGEANVSNNTSGGGFFNFGGQEASPDTGGSGGGVFGGMGQDQGGKDAAGGDNSGFSFNFGGMPSPPASTASTFNFF